MPLNRRQSPNRCVALLYILTVAAITTLPGEERPAWLEPKGAAVVAVAPVTDRILLVEFSEGIIEYAGLGEDRDANTLHYSLLDTVRASRVESYRVISADDPDYGSSGQTPLRVGRKSKGDQFNDLYAYQRKQPTHLLRHWLYLELPEPLQAGRTYQVRLDGLASNSNLWDLHFDPMTVRSPTIHVNQVGYRPQGPKYAYLSQWMGDFSSDVHQEGGLDLSDYADAEFLVVRVHDGAIAHRGQLAMQQPKTAVDIWTPTREVGPTRNLSRADVWQADFTALTAPGMYRIVVPRLGCSFPFRIDEDVFRSAYVTAMRGLFFQRAGIDRKVREFGDLIYPGAYRTNPMYYLPEADRKHVDKLTDTSRPVEGIWGWYHDAGDWDGYAHPHTVVPGLLLLAYTLNPDHFSDGDVGNVWRREADRAWIDEGVNGIPDLLDEAAWQLAFNRRARHALMKHGYGTGGVPAYVGREGCPRGTASWTDDRELGVHGEDAAITAVHAGLCAWYAVALRQAGQPEAMVSEWLNEAIDAYRWAMAREVGSEERLLAAAGLYRATGDVAYQADFRAAYTPEEWNNTWFEYWNRPSHRHLAICIFALLAEDHPGLDVELHTAIRTVINDQAVPMWMREGPNRGFRPTHLSRSQHIHTGSLSTPRSVYLQVAHAFTHESVLMDATQFAADYCLGANPMSYVWMSGLGWRSERTVFHPDSWSLLRPYSDQVHPRTVLPGLIAYGARSTFDVFGPRYRHAGDEDFSRSTAYPVIWRKTGTSFGGMGPVFANAKEIPKWAPNDSLADGPGNQTLFPVHEWRFPNPYSIAASEFTVHQNNVNTAFTFAALIAGPRPFTPSVRPVITLRLDTATVARNARLRLAVDACAATYEVEFFLGWQRLGAATAADHFAFDWDLARFHVEPGEHVVSARATAIDGLPSLPSAAARRTITVTAP